MSEDRPLCPGCFTVEAPQETEACPTCGFRHQTAADDRSPVALPLETVLNSRYRVGRVLGKPGGFGVTYLAFDPRLRTRVAIKEYMPRDVAARSTDGKSVVLYSEDEEESFQYGLERFLDEARMLAQFDHANIVGVRDFFEANGTAYLVMEYYEGKTLKAYLQEQPDVRMDPEVAVEIMLRVLDGLREVHAEGYLHRDVKPDNIYLTEEGRPILLDFGAARLALGEKSRSLSVVMTEGYAPYEQYRREGDQGTHTDAYGVGATLYRMVTGRTPPAATDRVVEDSLEAPHEVNSAVSKSLSRTIEGALAPGNKERTSTVEALQKQLQNALAERRGDSGSSPEAASESDPEHKAQESGGAEKPERKAKSKRSRTTEKLRGRRHRSSWTSALIIALLAAGLGLGGIAASLYPSGEAASESSAGKAKDAEGNERSKTEWLLEEAREDLKAGRLVKPESKNALATLRRLPDARSGKQKVQELLERIAKRLEDRGDSFRSEGEIEAAVDAYERSLSVKERSSPQKKLEEVRGQITERQKTEKLLASARSVLGRNDPSREALQKAARSAREVLELNPENGEAQTVLDRISRRLEEKGDAARNERELATAVRLYERSLEVRDRAPVAKKQSTVRERLDQQKKTPDDSEEEEQEIFMVVENQPELIGGMKSLQQSVEYPEFAQKAGIEGRVIVQFVVDEKGNVQDLKVTRGVHKLLNEEAIRAVKEQKFKPGKQRGEAVKVQMSLPVTFRLR